MKMWAQRNRRAAGFAVGLVALAVLLARPSAAEELLAGTVQTPDQPAPRSLDVLRVDGVDYLDLNETARLFRSTKYWRADLEKMVLKVQGRRVRLTVGSPYVYVEEDGANLYAPVRWHAGRLFAPVRLSTEILASIVPESVTYDRGDRSLRLHTGAPNVLAVQFEERQNGAMATLRLGAELAADLDFPRDDRVHVRVPGGVLSASMEGIRAGAGPIRSVEGTQEPNFALLSFELEESGFTAELLRRSSPPRLVVVFREPGAEDIPLPDYEGTPRRTRTVQTVVIDPGHGGSDPGVVAEGREEKVVALQLAERLRDSLRAEGFRAYLTREDDRFLSADERANRANSLGADLFVSLHANAWFAPERRGFAIGVPRAGGDAAGFAAGVTRWGQRDPRASQDEQLAAELLAESLASTIAWPNRGVRQADFAVLRGTTAPALLIECGFLTNPEEAMRLAESETQGKLAGAMASAISTWRAQMARGGTP